MSEKSLRKGLSNFFILSKGTKNTGIKNILLKLKMSIIYLKLAKLLKPTINRNDTKNYIKTNRS